MVSPDKWFSELITPDMLLRYRVKKTLYSGKTDYQQIDILDTETLGKSLILDGKTQSTEVDEHIYHETLVHPPMLLHSNPKSVFIGGGGEGATLREVLLHNSVERVVMVDLDPQVVQLCRQYLPAHSRGAFDDPRLELWHQDARGYLLDCQESFDVMVLDLVDPLDGGVAYTLYTREFYEIACAKLNPGGLLVTQSGPASLLNYTECFTPIVNTLSSLSCRVLPYSVYVPSFVTLWGFTIAFSGSEPLNCTASDMDQLINQRLIAPPRFYDGITHQGMFSLPSFLREGIDREQRVITDEEPVFMI